MTFYRNGQPASIATVRSVMADVVSQGGIDPADLAGILGRCGSEEEARDEFFDLTEIEIIAND